MLRTVYVLGIVSRFTAGSISDPESYVFQEEQVKRVFPAEKNKYSKYDFNHHYLNTLESEPQTDLCRDSNPLGDLCEFVRKKNSLSVDYYRYEGTDVFNIVDLKGNLKTDVAIQCSTIPNIWMRVGNSENELIVTSLKHVAEEYKFNHEFFESIQIIPSSEYVEHHRLEWQKNYLTKLPEHDCDYFCFWAHKRVGLFRPDQQRKNLDESIIADKAKFYKVSYTDKEAEEHIAIKCRIEPEMYLRLGRPGNKKELLAMVPKESEVAAEKVSEAVVEKESEAIVEEESKILSSEI